MHTPNSASYFGLRCFDREWARRRGPWRIIQQLLPLPTGIQSLLTNAYVQGAHTSRTAKIRWAGADIAPGPGYEPSTALKFVECLFFLKQIVSIQHLNYWSIQCLSKRMPSSYYQQAQVKVTFLFTISTIQRYQLQGYHRGRCAFGLIVAWPGQTRGWGKSSSSYVTYYKFYPWSPWVWFDLGPTWARWGAQLCLEHAIITATYWPCCYWVKSRIGHWFWIPSSARQCCLQNAYWKCTHNLHQCHHPNVNQADTKVKILHDQPVVIHPAHTQRFNIRYTCIGSRGNLQDHVRAMEID